MSKQDYFVKSCIYNRVCVVGKKETIYPLLEEIQILQTVIKDIAEQFSTNNVTITEQGLKEIKDEYLSLLKAILWMLDGAKYLWTDNNKIC